MADSAKREKIAAARKKLKQFQQKSGRSSSKTRESTTSPQPKSAKTDGNNSNSDTVQENCVEIINNGDHSSELEHSKADSPISKGDKSETVVENSFAPSSQELEKKTGPVEVPNSSQKSLSDSRDTTYSPRELELRMSKRPSASTESLHQLSRQINGILAESPTPDSYIPDDSSIAELETRNRELASLLERHSQANEQLNTQLNQVREHAQAVQTQLEQEREAFTEKLKKEVGPLKEQLQVHIQTIGILVAEKTELQSQLGQAQKIGEQRFDEIEELSGRLKASRQRVADLERSLSTSTNSSQQFEKSSKENAKEIDRLKLELYKSNKSQEEHKQQLSELQEKLSAKNSECSGLQQNVEDLQRRLEMAELYTQQLSNQNENSNDSLKIVEQLQKEREELVTQVQQYNESFQKVSAERDQMTEHYKQYMEQLQHQNHQLTQQISTLTEDREQLLNRHHELEGAVLELQRKLEDVESSRSDVDSKSVAEAHKELISVQTDYDELLQRHEAQIRDNAQLSRFLEEKESRILELEGTLEQMGEEAGDKAQLLENIQSDKTALSRALTQNKDLKVQLAELQNGFVKLSNDNMELLTSLQTQQHSSREMTAKLAQQEDELKEIREALAKKEHELHEHHQSSHEVMKEQIQHEQIQDRLRHYEAQAQLVETLRKELHAGQDMVDALTTQNSELRAMLIKATEVQNNNPDEQQNSDKREEVVESLSGAIKQLESERNQLMTALKEQRDLSDHLSVKVSDMEEELHQKNASFSDNDRVSPAEYEQMKRAMEMIQEKYNKVMRDKADLSDKADQLEHIVVQLQGETDTIGEYISLYHHQRALLQQRELQKNDYISHLAQDREQLQDKLGELQALVMQLMGEKNMLHSYTEETLRPVSPDIQPHLSSKMAVNGAQRRQQDDWPDYTSSDTDSESEVETIVGGKEGLAAPSDFNDVIPERTVETRSQPLPHPPSTAPHPPKVEEDGTAHKILNLLSEIGHSNLVDRSNFAEQHFHPCKYCKGRLQIL